LHKYKQNKNFVKQLHTAVFFANIFKKLLKSFALAIIKKKQTYKIKPGFVQF